MNTYLFLFANLFLINIIMALLVIFFGRKDPQRTIFWVMVLTFLPIIGFILYLFFGQDFTREKKFEEKKEKDRFIRMHMDKQIEVLYDQRFSFTNWRSQRYYGLIKQNLHSDEAFYSQNNSINLFFEGNKLFDEMIKDMEEAKHSIEVQFYIFKPDKLGNKFLEVMAKKASEGVRVRLLLDAIGGRRLNKKDLEKFHSYGGETAFFFPSLFPLLNPRINYRNHRKLMIIDDHIGYIGGFNVGNEYIGLNKRFGYWRDTHSRIVGDATIGMKMRFLKDWYNTTKEEVDERDKVLNGPLIHRGKTGVQIVTSGPDTDREAVHNAYMRMIVNAKDRIYIQTPYFVPDRGIYEALVIAILAGVEVHIMIPRKRDHPFVHWASLSYLGELLALGAKGYLYERGFLHAKTLVVDDYLSSVGSANMDVRSFSLNFEANAVIYDLDINEQLVTQFVADTFYSDELLYEEYLKRSTWTKIKEAISRLFSPIL